MLSLRSTSSSAAALDRADISARAAARPDAKGDVQQHNAAVPDASAPRGIEPHVVGVTDGLSTVAAIGVTVGTIPAVLCRMRDIAVASNSGTLDETERAKLRNEYMDLSLQVSSAIGESGRAAQVAPATDAAPSQDAAGQEQHPGHEPGKGDAPSPTPARAEGPRPTAAEAAAAQAASPAPALLQRIEVARPAALAQFHRQHATQPRAHLSVHA
jgi:hypothetical protein